MELLVGLVVSGILVGVIFQFLQGQGQFVRAQSAREEVQSNARAAVELITSDLRGAPPAALREAAADLIRFYSPREWGLLCTNIADVGDAGTITFTVRVPGTVSSDFVANNLRWGVAVGQTANVSATAPASWSFARGVTMGAPGSCAALGAAAGAGSVDERTFGGTFEIVGGGPTAVPAGALVFLYEDVRYDVAISTGGRPYIRRMIGYSGGSPIMQPLAGPLPPDSGLRFRYFTRTGAELDPSLNMPPVLTAVQMWDVASIQVVVHAESSARFAGTAQFSKDSTVVRLRN